MAQMSSEEALNGIFNILDTMVSQQQEKKKETIEQKADSTIVSLLQGIVETAKEESAATVGEQLEKLSKGLVSMEQIDNDVLNKVATSIGNVNTVLSSLKVDDNTFTNIDSFLKAINKMTEINAEGAKKIVDFIQGLTIQNSKSVGRSVGIIKAVVETMSKLVALDMIKLQENIGKLDVKTAQRLGKFISALVSSISKTKLKNKDIQKIIKPIGDLMGGLSALVTSNVFKMQISLNPIRGWLLGRQLGQFIGQIAKYLKGKEISENVKYIGGILDPLVKIADPEQKFSIFKVMKVLNPITAKMLASFFVAFATEIPDNKTVAQTVNSMVQLLNVIFDIKKIQILNFMFAVKSLTQKRAQKIVDFFNTILKEKWDVKQVKVLSSFMNAWNNALKTLLYGIVFIALTIKITSFKTIIESVLVVRYLIKFMKNTITDLAKKLKVKDVKGAQVIIRSLSSAIGMIGGIIIGLSIVTKIVGLTAVIASLIVMRVAVSGFKSLIEDLSEKKLDKSLKNVQGVLTGIGIMIMSLSVSMLLLSLTAKNNSTETILASIGILTLFTAGTIFIVNKLSKIGNKKLTYATDAMLKISAVFAIIALVSATLLAPIGKRLDDVSKGALVISFIIALGIFAVKSLDKHGKRIDRGVNNLIKISAVFALVAIISVAFLIPIGKKAPEVYLGAIVTMFIIAGLVAGVYVLNMVKGKDALWGVLATATLAIIYMGIALITKDLLIPIGQNGKEAGIGMGITLFIIITLIAGTYFLAKVDGKKAAYAIFATAAMAFILLGISLIVKDILIPIGKMWDDALIGAGVVIGTLAIFGTVLFFIGKFADKYAVELAVGAVIMTAVAIVMLVTGAACLAFAIESKKILELNEGGAVFLGAAVMAGVLGLMGLVMYGVSKLEKFLPDTIIGGIVMSAIGAVMDIVGGTMVLFAWEAKKIDDLNKGGAVFLGAATMIGLLTIMGTFMTALGAMTPILPFITLGAVVMTAIAGVMTVVTGTMILFMKALELMLPYNTEKLKKTGETAVTLFEVMFDVIKAAAPNPVQMVQATAAAAFSPIIMAVFGVLALIVSEMKYITEICNAKMIQTFSELMIGKGNDDKNSVLGSMQAIVKAFSGFNGTAMALVISLALRPILNTISKYIDIIMKVATMNYIAGYDDNGKPMYEHLPATVFEQAAEAVTNGFTTFISKLSDGFNEMVALTLVVLSVLTLALNPIIDTVGKFVDVVMKLATGTYIIGYDNKKNPIYKKLTATKFSDAALAISVQFSIFLQCLSDAFDKMSVKAMLAISTVGQVMEPVMDAVSKFVDTVIKVATMQIVTGYDKNGKPEYEQVDPSIFFTSAIFVSASFGNFIEQLGTSFKQLQPNMIWAMDAMKDSIMPIMDGVSKFVDAIMKLATGTYTDYYMQDKDGNYTVPHLAKVTSDDFLNAAISVATTFGIFIDELVTVFERHGSFWGNKTEDALNAIGGSVGPVMEGLGKYVDAILKLATGVYVDHYKKDKDGKLIPITKKLKKGAFTQAAREVGRMFVEFINYLVQSFANEGFIEKAESIADIIKNTINPIMTAVKNFSATLKPFLGLTSNKKGTTAQSKDYLCLQPNFIRTISKNIANAFVDFITIISDNLSTKENMEKYNKIQSTAKIVMQVMGTIKKSVDSLSKIIKAMTDDQGKVLSQGSEVATKFTSVLTQLATYFSNSSKIFETSIQSTKDAKKFVDGVYQIASVYRKIINQLTYNDKVKPSSIVSQFGTVLTKMESQMRSLSNNSEKVNFQTTGQFMDLYLEIAEKMIYLSREMNRQKQLGLHIDMFINNIKRLTSPEINRNMNVTSGSLRTYTSRLKTFTSQIQVTTSKVEIYTTKLESARKALKALDDQIINNEKKRNQALQEFANKVNNIATAVDRMRFAFESLDENKILSRFDGIRELLDLITTNTPSNTNKSQGNTQQHQVVQPGNRVVTQQQGIHQSNRPGNTNHNYYGNNMPMQGRVTFYFKNTTIDGFFKNA